MKKTETEARCRTPRAVGQDARLVEKIREVAASIGICHVGRAGASGWRWNAAAPAKDVPALRAELDVLSRRTERGAGRKAFDAGLRGQPDRRRSHLWMDGNSDRQDGAGRNFHGSRPRIVSWQACDRAAACTSTHQPADRYGARESGRSRQAGGCVHVGGTERRREDGDRAGAGRLAVRRRAQPDHHQHVGVSGSRTRCPRSKARLPDTSVTARAAF